MGPIRLGLFARRRQSSCSVERDHSVNQDLAHQRKLLDHWLQSDEAVRLARRLVTSRRIRRSPEEVVSEAWLKLDRFLGSRTEPLPDIGDPTSVARFMYRVLDNLTRDMLRAQMRRTDVELVDQLLSPSHSERVESKVILEQLIGAIGSLADTPRPCDGCSPAMVASTALNILHLALSASDAGQLDLDDLLSEALRRASHDRSLTPAALRQRKSRCGRCITELLADGFREIGLVAA